MACHQTWQSPMLTCLLLLVCQSFAILHNFTQFVSHSFYQNMKYDNTFIVQNYTYLNGSSQRHLAHCAQKCANLKLPQCLAFNFYAEPDQTSYTCELLKDNYCKLTFAPPTRIGLTPQENGTVYDVATPSGEPCIGSFRFCWLKLPRPGCFGPNCTDYCGKTCTEIQDWLQVRPNRLFASYIRPDGTNKSERYVQCQYGGFYLMRRAFRYEPSNQSYILETNYRFNFPYPEINLAISMNGYTQIKFTFAASDGTLYNASYGKITLTENGTLSMTYLGTDPSDDGLELINGTIKDALYNPRQRLWNCGIFWLLDKGNLSCPGGDVDILGRFNVTLNETGISWPPATKNNNKLLISGAILLS